MAQGPLRENELGLKEDSTNALANFRRALAMDTTMDGLKEKIEGLEKAK